MKSTTQKFWFIGAICFSLAGVINLIDERYTIGIAFIIIGLVFFFTSIRDSGDTDKSTESKLPVVDLENIDSEIKRLISEGEKIKAVKMYRTAAGVGLAEAMRYVDSIHKGVKLPDTNTEDIDSEVRNLILQGEKIKAIKVYRMATGLGLREAKEYIDIMSQKLR